MSGIITTNQGLRHPMIIPKTYIPTHSRFPSNFISTNRTTFKTIVLYKERGVFCSRNIIFICQGKSPNRITNGKLSQREASY